MYNIEENLWQGAKLDQAPEPIDAILALDNDVPNWQGDKILVWIPIDDGAFPGLIWLEMVVNIIENLLAANRKVYIHCKAGISRSTMVTAAYLMKKYTWTRDEALEHISIRNVDAGPNMRFMKGLKEWQDRVCDC